MPSSVNCEYSSCMANSRLLPAKKTGESARSPEEKNRKKRSDSSQEEGMRLPSSFLRTTVFMRSSPRPQEQGDRSQNQKQRPPKRCRTIQRTAVTQQRVKGNVAVHADGIFYHVYMRQQVDRHSHSKRFLEYCYKYQAAYPRKEQTPVYRTIAMSGVLLLPSRADDGQAGFVP